MSHPARLLFLFLSLLASRLLEAQPDTSVDLPSVTVRDARFDQTGFSAWRADSLPLSGALSLSDRLLWENPLAVRANAPGTLATVSARGAGPSRTPVFWNGLNLQSPQNGVVDAALLPVWPGDRLEVRYGGQSAALSAGAMGGSVLVESGVSPAQGFFGKAGVFGGSFGRQELQADAGFATQKLALEARASWQRADNNFPFKNTTLIGQPEQRQPNNEAEVLDIQQFIRLNAGEKNELRVAAWHQRAFREIPPAMTASPAQTWQRDRSTRVAASWEHAPGARALWQTRAAFSDEALFFKLAGDVDSSRARTALLSTEYSAVAGSRLHWKTGTAAIRQWAQADGYTDTARWYTQTRLAGFGMAEWRLSRLRLSALLRQEWAESQAAPFTWSLGGQIGWGKAGDLRFHLSRNFNLPTFNDRFWLEYGREALKPEKGHSAEAGWVLLRALPGARKASLVLESTVFHLLLDDWILWQPGADGVFRPGNLRKVWSRGLEMTARWSVKTARWDIGLSARYQYAKTTNAAVYDGAESALRKQLPYAPNHSGSLVFKAARGAFSAQYLQQWTGRRYTSSDNAARLEGFSTGTLLGQFALSPWKRRAANSRHTRIYIDARVENLWDSPYQIIAFRPMPGRAFRAGCTLAW